ncbi:CRISPR-associated protein Cas4 [bacterium]|nr:CRISPR-associated protein Cas4 [bacterium]
MEGIYITPSEVIEYLYCPRFIFYMNVLCIPQHEEQRYKVLKGRELHEGKERVNRDYLRKKLGVTARDILVYLASERYHLKGIVDEVLSLEDGTLAPLDYKFAEYKDTTYRTHKYQSVLYGLLIKDNYGQDVRKGYVCYIRSRHKVKEIPFCQKDFDEALRIVDEMLEIIQKGFYPKKTGSSIRCVDCCYRNICI